MARSTGTASVDCVGPETFGSLRSASNNLPANSEALEFDPDGKFRRLTLNEAAMKVKEMAKALAAIVKEVEIVVGVT